MNLENWLPVKGYEGIYFVSDMGNFKNSKGALITQYVRPNGYVSIRLHKIGSIKDYFSHILVAEAFCPQDEYSIQVHHKNGNKQDNWAENLMWCTPAENVNFSLKHPYKQIKATEIETGKVTYYPTIASVWYNGFNPAGVSACLHRRGGTSQCHTWEYA